MRLVALLAAGLFAGTLTAADDKKDEKKVKDEEAVLGTWAMEKLDVGGPGGGPSAEQLAKVRVVFKKDGKLTLGQGDESDKKNEFKLDPAAKPKAIDIIGDSSTVLGVYELDGDVLKLCVAPVGKTRPAELKGDSKAGVVAMTLRRIKDEKKDK